MAARPPCQLRFNHSPSKFLCREGRRCLEEFRAVFRCCRSSDHITGRRAPRVLDLSRGLPEGMSPRDCHKGDFESLSHDGRSHRAEEEKANPNIVRCWASHSESARARRQNQTWTNLNSATVLVPQVSSKRLVLAKGETIRESNRDRRLAPTLQHIPSLQLIISPSPEIKSMQEQS